MILVIISDARFVTESFLWAEVFSMNRTEQFVHESNWIIWTEDRGLSLNWEMSDWHFIKEFYYNVYTGFHSKYVN